MTTVTVSPKFQVVIPESVRKAMKVKPGEKFEVLHLDGRVELIPVRPIQSLRGFARGMDTRVDREEDRV